MDIKERIDALTEAEAKAVLKWFIGFSTVFVDCDECPFEDSCQNGETVKECERRFFEGVLNEVQNEREHKAED